MHIFLLLLNMRTIQLAAVSGLILLVFLTGCSIQKRTLRPGFHVERIGALNKKPSLQVQAQKTANLPVLPNESVGLSFTPPAAETFAEDAENLDKQEDLAGLAAVTPPQSIESRSVQRELGPMRSDSTGTNPVEGQVAPLSRAKLKMKIAKAEKALELFTFLIIIPGAFALGFPFWFFRSWKKSQISALRKEANLPYKLAWYNTDWLWISLLAWPVFPCALTCRLIDQHRMKNSEEPMSWKSKTIFFTLLTISMAWYVWNFGTLGGSWGFSSFSFRF